MKALEALLDLRLNVTEPQKSLNVITILELRVFAFRANSHPTESKLWRDIYIYGNDRELNIMCEVILTCIKWRASTRLLT